jgi:hypothetical protein
MLAWPDGGRQLVGLDGIVVRVEPTLWQVDPRALAYLDSRVPPALVARMPVRAPEAIPQPKPKPKADTPAPAAPTAPARRGTGEIVGIVILSIVTVFCLGSGLLGTLGVAADASSDSGEWGVIVAGWVITAAFVLALVLLVRKGRNRPR